MFHSLLLLALHYFFGAAVRFVSLDGCLLDSSTNICGASNKCEALYMLGIHVIKVVKALSLPPQPFPALIKGKSLHLCSYPLTYSQEVSSFSVFCIISFFLATELVLKAYKYV